MRKVCIVPARWGSTRFPGKPLAPIVGATGVSRPLILRTLDVAAKADCFGDIYAATDDERIAQVVWDDGYDCILTSEANRNGTERCAQVARMLNLAPNDIIVNLQGDSLLTPPAWLSALVSFMELTPNSPVATTIFHRGHHEAPNPGEVQAIVSNSFKAMYFTRGPIAMSPKGWHQHFGVYAYTGAALMAYDKLQPTDREEAEMLEQLRFMECSWAIQCIHPMSGEAPEREVNYPDDVAAVEEALRQWNIE